MKLLFDANLSPILVSRLHDLFPQSSHVFDHGIERDDATIWEAAKAGGFVIISKDADFQSRAALLGPPPKVVCIQLGNCATADIESRLRSAFEDLAVFEADSEASIFFLRKEI